MIIDCLRSYGADKIMESINIRKLIAVHNKSCKRLYGVAIGGWYRHFKGGYARVINIATHSETGEKLVIYECMNTLETGCDNLIYARPVEMFLSEVDKTKYSPSEYVQKHRFELISDGDYVSNNEVTEK